LSCAICETRKEKRFCPAVHGQICTQCCGTEREVTLDCPGNCPYLIQARAHEKPRSMEEIDPTTLFPEIAIPEDFLYRHQHLLGGLAFTLAKAAHGDRLLNDNDLLGALTSLIKNWQRLANSGLIYEESLHSGAQQLVLNDLRNSIEQFREVEHKHLGHTTLKDGDVVTALVFLLRTAAMRTSGRPRSRAFIFFLFEQFPKDDALIASPDQAPSGLIVP
jgi:hypothetical protein